MNEFTLLYIEDDLEILENVTFLFNQYFKEIYTAKDGEEGLAAYHKYKPDIIVSDIDMPKLDGMELISTIRENDKNIPIVIITAYSDRQKLLNAIDIGVSSYVIKPFTLDTLKETIFKVIDRKITQNQAIKDSLTSLYNRTMFSQMIQNSIDIAKRYDTYLTYVMLDIDHFKEYNDTYGHLEGDKALKSVASVLETHTNRVDDKAFRIGGEEFSIVTLGLDEAKSLVYANKIREDILALKIEHSKSSTHKFLSISIGVYVAKGENIVDEQQIYHLSDEALYSSKKAGRNMLSISKGIVK